MKLKPKGLKTGLKKKNIKSEDLKNNKVNNEHLKDKNNFT